MFKDRWGLLYLFHELNLSETILEEKEPNELFPYFREGLGKYSLGEDPFVLTPRPIEKDVCEEPLMPVSTKSHEGPH